MKLTNSEILNAKAPLEQLLKERLPVKIAYGLAKTAQKVEAQLKIIDRVRHGLIKTYGAVDPDKPQQLKVDPNGPNYAKFAEEYGELMSQEVELVVDVVTLPETLEIEPSVLMLLDKFIKI